MKRKRKNIKTKSSVCKTMTSLGKKQIEKREVINVKTPFNKTKLKEFKGRLLNIKKSLHENMGHLEDSTLKKSGKDARGDLSGLPIHLADSGSDTFEQDFSLGLLEGEDIELKEVDESLERIEDKTYGICEECSNPIGENRLKVIPYARFCVQCKESMEKH
ncbi:MAG: TraR/DksA C4-type zinc finger protein [Planctomycetota bacterium]|nr:TraR/DksA C4-type zinc finger protein [Planctomycetota bacterium]MDI6788299.1 TraR/DksA C4-type zinc finger protein [Planctomycetota bacterium]